MNKIENKQIKHHKTFIKTKNKAKRKKEKQEKSKHFQEPYQTLSAQNEKYYLTYSRKEEPVSDLTLTILRKY